MEKKEFLIFCEKEFMAHGFIKQKKSFYLAGFDLMCGIFLQKSNYGDIYYVNFCYFLESPQNNKSYPTQYECDIFERIVAMSKKSTVQGKCFITAQIEYKEYDEEELRPYFDKEFEERILPPIYHGKKYILDNLGKLYFLTLRKEEVMRKLQS